MATNEELLVDAQAKYHALITGVSPRVVVDQSGERVEFTAANKAGLAQYIQSLQNSISNTSLNRPMRVFF